MRNKALKEQAFKQLVEQVERRGKTVSDLTEFSVFSCGWTACEQYVRYFHGDAATQPPAPRGGSDE